MLSGANWVMALLQETAPSRSSPSLHLTHRYAQGLPTLLKWGPGDGGSLGRLQEQGYGGAHTSSALLTPDLHQGEEEGQEAASQSGHAHLLQTHPALSLGPAVWGVASESLGSRTHEPPQVPSLSSRTADVGEELARDMQINTGKGEQKREEMGQGGEQRREPKD